MDLATTEKTIALIEENGWHKRLRAQGWEHFTK